MLTRLISFTRNLYDNRYMIRSLALKDIKRQYTGSFLGIFWAVIHPVITVLTYYFVFSFVFGPKVRGQYGHGSFAVWLLCGLVPWLYFSTIVRGSSLLLIINKALVTKTIFPSEVFPVIALISNSLSHLFGLAIIFVALLVTGGQVGVHVLLVPVYFLFMCIMILGFSWIFSSLNVFVPDVGQFLTLGMTLWYFYTPVFWPVTIIPEKFRPILYVNPMYHLVEGYRVCIMSNKTPDMWSLAYLAGFSIVVFIAGGLLYKRLKPAFADVL